MSEIEMATPIGKSECRCGVLSVIAIYRQQPRLNVIDCDNHIFGADQLANQGMTVPKQI